MRALLITTLLIAVAGCSAERKQGEAVATAPAMGAAAAGQSQPATVAALPSRANPQATFASLPDRGELVAADPARHVQKRGDYTFEPVRISEAHALAAVGGRALVVDTPDGRQLRLAYAEHVDHGDGNWTWIGRDDRGQRALITFGERAVFGTIPDARGALQITTDRNGGWMVQAGPGAGSTRTQLAALTGRADFRIPPTPRENDATRTMEAASARIVKAAAGATSSAVVDVAVGYTPGMINEYGSGPAVVTRIQYVIAYANDAYANSGIAHRVRLVRTVQVNFDDNSLNDTALNQLTGDDGTGNPVTVPAALQPLRNAVTQYGADLVVLMRNFLRTQESCGIAWLLGGDGTSLEGAQDYAFGVVSDGEEISGSTRYICEDSTLAHEMGHLMGQTHDAENATGTGAHPYSYGYKEASATGFYTIMAYGGSDQFAVPYFSTPLRSYNGRPMGEANVSDNARSMVQTMPIVANFRASIVRNGRARNDVDGDGKSDLILRNQSVASSNFGYWVMNGASRVRTGYTTMGTSYRIAATGDFNGDGKADIAWTSNLRDVRVWLGNGTGFGATATTPGSYPKLVGTYGAGWAIVGAGDVDGDGKADLILRNSAAASANVGYWIMNGTTRVRAGYTTLATSYRVAGLGDFNADGKLDIAWTSSSRDVRLWFGNGYGFGGSTTTPGSFPVIAGSYASGWEIAGVGDVDGDGRSDVVLRYGLASIPNNVAYWVMNGAVRSRIGYATLGSSYRIAATGDYNGDGKLDIAWTSSLRDVRLWFGNGTGFGASPTTPGSYPVLAGSYGAGWGVLQ